MTIKYQVKLHDRYIEEYWADKLVYKILPAVGESPEAFFGTIQDGDDILTYKRRDAIPGSVKKIIEWSHMDKKGNLFPMKFPVKEYNSAGEAETLYVAGRAWYFTKEKEKKEAAQKEKDALRELAQAARAKNSLDSVNGVSSNHATIENTCETTIKDMIEEAGNTTKILPFDREHEGTLAKYKGHKL